MALFTGTPVILSSSPFLINNGDSNYNRGVMVSGSNLYYAAYQTGGAASGSTHVLKSTDSGATWAFEDDSNKPASSGTNGLDQGGAAKTAVWDSSAAKIHFTGRKSNAPIDLAYLYFDTGTDLWHPTLVDSGSILVANVAHAALRSDGSLVVLYISATAAPNNLFYRIFSAGSWGSEITLVAGAGAETLRPQGIVIDSSDTAHVLYTINAGQSDYHYVTLTSGGSIGTPAAVVSESSQAQRHMGVIWNDRILFTSINSAGSAVRLFEGTPVSSPVWTALAVATTSNSSSVPQIGIHPDNSKVYLLWDKNLYGGSPNQKVMYNTYDGATFTTEDTFWDIQANPAPGAGSIPPGDNFVQNMRMSIEGGFIHVVSETEVDFPAENTSLVYTAVAVSPAVVHINRMY